MKNHAVKMTHLKLSFVVLVLFTSSVLADVITDWNVIARNIVVDAKLNTPFANRALAIIHTSAYVAVNAITQRYPQQQFILQADPDASVEAAVCAVNYVSLLALLPEHNNAISRAYKKAIAVIPDGAAKTAGLTIGEKAAKLVLLARSMDGSEIAETYLPHTAAGKYVPTMIPAVPQWVNRKPWVLSKPSQFRAAPPPALTSKEWADDFAEVKSLGAINSATRTQEQTNIARFWEATLPPIYHGVVHSVATQEGRDVTQNARLFAAITRATDDAMMAVFDSKYHHAFWRPITAIRNGDIDGNPDTKAEPGWTPFIPTPMHPEYPCAHCVVASTVGAILKAETQNQALPVLSTSSVTANGETRSWHSIDAFVQEVSDARVYDGVHYRTSTEAGNDMGKKVGELAVATYSVNGQ